MNKTRIISNKDKRRNRIRSKISGTTERPRLSVFKSNRFIYGQIIDDVSGNTLVSASSKGVPGKGTVSKAKEVGKKLAADAKVKKISSVVFDRGGNFYTGQVKALAEGAREGGLNF